MTAVIRGDEGDRFVTIAAFEVPSLKISFAVHFCLLSYGMIYRISYFQAAIQKGGLYDSEGILHNF